MRFGSDIKRNPVQQLDEERKRRLSREKSSEELMRQRFSDDRQNRPALTGYKPLKKEEPSVKETVRMENSRGILALGGDERKKTALVVTEKGHPHGPAGTERERVLEERGERDYPAGQSRAITNPGGRERGAVGFLLGPGQTRTQMMEHIKRYMDGHDQKTLGHMMPFMVTEKELAYKRQLEEALQETRRSGQRSGKDKTVKIMDRLLEEKKEELIRERQKEVCFGQKLEKSMEEEKKTVWKDFSGRTVGMRKKISPDTDNLPDDGPMDEENKLCSIKE